MHLTASGRPALAVYDVADLNTIWVPAITIAGHQYVLVQLHHRGSALDIRGGIKKKISFFETLSSNTRSYKRQSVPSWTNIE